jgi:hypothetical protein
MPLPVTAPVESCFAGAVTPPGGGRRNGGDIMHKTAVILAVLMAVSSPAFAKAKKAKPEVKPAHVVQQENTLRLLKEGLPLVLPVGLQVVYFNTHKDGLK